MKSVVVNTVVKKIKCEWTREMVTDLSYYHSNGYMYDKLEKELVKELRKEIRKSKINKIKSYFE